MTKDCHEHPAAVFRPGIGKLALRYRSPVTVTCRWRRTNSAVRRVVCVAFSPQDVSQASQRVRHIPFQVAEMTRQIRGTHNRQRYWYKENMKNKWRIAGNDSEKSFE